MKKVISIKFFDIVTEYRELFSSRQSMLTVIISFLFFTVSLFINFFAGTYATEIAGNPVPDLILSNFRRINTNWIFVQGSIIFWIFVIFLLIISPKRAPFVLKSIALFILVRSIFVTLTHLGPFPDRNFIESNDILKKLTFGGDLFFSGHTGLPFLLGLVFWRDKVLRYFFIICSLIFGVAVLLGHFHYSIDVFAAFFITYSIYHLARRCFPKDYILFLTHRPVFDLFQIAERQP